MRKLIGASAFLGLVACTAEIPDSGAGVGFSDTPPQPEATALASALPPAGAVSAEDRPFEVTTLGPAPVSPGSQVSANSANADLAAETAAALAAVQANSGVLPVQASPSNPAPDLLNNPGISDENDFAAVSDRQSIASDAERLARNRQNYQAVSPTAVPERPASSDPNIVAYALGTQHARGTRVYSRSGVNLATKAQRACAKYVSPDQAQIDFLAKGGPDRDRLGLDPDGDGFACGWDPAPFRAAKNG
ncbi:MAG: hypothetical protein ACWA5A_06645 [Marinibacterium sp.]